MTRRLDVKIVLMLVVTVLAPLGVSVFLVARALDSSLGLGVNRAIATHMQQGLELYRLYIEGVRSGFETRLGRSADSHELAEAAAAPDETTVRGALERFVASDPSLVSVRLAAPEGGAVEVEAVRMPGQGRRRTLSLERAVALGPYTSIEAVFGADAGVFEAYEKAGQEFDTYKALVKGPPGYLHNRFVAVYGIILAVAMALSIVLGVFSARRMARRIHRLAAATAAVAGGDLSVRVDPGPRDEVGELVESFNGMVGELEVSRTRIEYLQKISAWQDMARRLAHEIKNPLTPIHLAAQQLKEKYDGSNPAFARLLNQSTQVIEEEVATLQRLTSAFSAFAKLPEVRPEVVSLGEFLEECEASLAHFSAEGGVRMAWSRPERPVYALLDRMMMKRVIDNLVRNAAEALKESHVPSPTITVSAERRGGKRPEVEIRVADNGPGIRPEHHPSIFDPYFTTKSEGTGLGLAICKKIVFEHGGRIWLDDGPREGATFVIVLPSPGAKKGGKDG
ncbi:MAG: ATP-binding protein [Deltaproteobacteria bacterium]|nr:ATP-binding protein [Deltaproteobacteria bacterium]